LKRYIAILLSIFYLSLSIGLTVNRHYCGGKLASIELGLTHKNSCPCGDKPMKKDCCKDIYKIYKLISHFDNSIHIDYNHETFFIGDITTPIVGKLCFYQSIDLVSNYYHPPPLSRKIPIFLLDRSLLI